MLARLDNLPQRHRSVTLHAAAPDVDFRTSMRCKRIPGRHDPCSRNFPSQACHAKPRPLAYRLRKLRELQDPGSGRSALGLAIGITLAETAETPAMARPMPRQARGQGGKVGNPFFGPYCDTKVFLGWPMGRKMARPSSSSTARRQFGGPMGIGGRGSMAPAYSGRPWRSPASNRKIPYRFNAGKPQTPANGAYLFRPSASQSSDRDAQVGMFEIEVLARGHARFGGAVSRPSRSAARPALSAWPAWHPPQPARSSSG
jgi:hypothetical protein